MSFGLLMNGALKDQAVVIADFGQGDEVAYVIRGDLRQKDHLDGAHLRVQSGRVLDPLAARRGELDRVPHRNDLSIELADRLPGDGDVRRALQVFRRLSAGGLGEGLIEFDRAYLL